MQTRFRGEYKTIINGSWERIVDRLTDKQAILEQVILDVS